MEAQGPSIAHDQLCFLDISPSEIKSQFKWTMSLPIPATSINYMALTQLDIFRQHLGTVDSNLFLRNILKIVTDKAATPTGIESTARAGEFTQKFHYMLADLPSTLKMSDLPGYKPEWEFQGVVPNPTITTYLREIGEAFMSLLPSWITAVRYAYDPKNFPANVDALEEVRFSHPYLPCMSTSDGVYLTSQNGLGHVATIVGSGALANNWQPREASGGAPITERGLVIPFCNLIIPPDQFPEPTTTMGAHITLDEISLLPNIPTGTVYNHPQVPPHYAHTWTLNVFDGEWYKPDTERIYCMGGTQVEKYRYRHKATRTVDNGIPRWTLQADSTLATPTQYMCYVGPWKENVDASSINVHSNSEITNAFANGWLYENPAAPPTAEHPSRQYAGFRSAFRTMERENLISLAQPLPMSSSIPRTRPHPYARKTLMSTPLTYAAEDTTPMNNIVAVYCSFLSHQQLGSEWEPVLAIGVLENIVGFPNQKYQTLRLKMNTDAQVEWRRTTATGQTNQLEFYIEDLSGNTPDFYHLSSSCYAMLHLKYATSLES